MPRGGCAGSASSPSTDAGHLARLRATADVAQSAKSGDEVVGHVRDQLVELLTLRDCRFEYGTLLGRPPRLEADGTVAVGRREWDVDRLGLPDEEIELRAYGNGRYLGRFMLRPTPGVTPPLEARLVAVTLAGQAGTAPSGGH
ncbi:hypothetical protein I5Q34_25495 [Streptomyces sp. AV19]|uniref:hypothetical protein n=1 Tax=Streptomyces sp. AV19 TaxID=2793068 RepID=UPI0018FE9254|nr:hypothetical protein [Streptomyces sp. AV19]MBH1937585.1 hypothetical protein [Streptomyces sp. AV19]MDG4533600.1 hypothetical protein [Streptomyces sp. AV19]